MNTTYEWLYSNYAVPQLEKIEKTETAQVDLLVQSLNLSSWGRIQILDKLADIRFHWGSEAFALGVQMGMQLTPPQEEL
ncbi:MAG: hypothetical protein K2P20_03675 [Oscillospiraceae bacterium]|nr:hypothetical protein [Oscillospiraceae bacterium]